MTPERTARRGGARQGGHERAQVDTQDVAGKKVVAGHASTGKQPSRSVAGAGPGQGSVRVTMVRSSIGARPKHRGGLRALGLRRLGQVRVLPDRPEIRGMIAGVSHLVEVVELGDPAPAGSAASKLVREKGRE